MKLLLKSLLILIILTLGINTTAQTESQEIKNKNYSWGMFGGGPNSIGGLGASGIISIKRGISLFSVRGNYAQEPRRVNFFQSSQHVDIVGDLSLLYGFAFSKNNLIASFSLGGGMAFGNFQYEYKTAGIALDFQVIHTPYLKPISLGVNFYGNLNNENPFAGLSICLVFHFTRIAEQN